MPKNPKGFTIVELLVAIVIIGIIALIAIPSYRNYIRNAASTEATSMARVGLVAVDEYYNINYSFPNSNQEAGLASPTSYTGKYVTQVNIESGTVFVTFNPGFDESSVVFQYRPTVN
jgi:type IV pilus assembly protein PilA